MIVPELNPCKFCKQVPQIVSVPGDLCYVVCDCGKWSPYEFVGTTAKGAAENWNTINQGATKCPQANGKQYRTIKL